jgi:primary-amine oxidase
MRIISQTRVMAFGAAILLTLANGAAWAALTCAQNNPIDVQMTTANGGGAHWELCWANDAKKGLVLNQVTLTPKPGAPTTLILQQASLAQVLVAYDNNSGNQHLVSDAGLPLTPLAAAECPGGTLLAGSLVCQMIVPRGYAWRGSGQLQGKSLIIFGVSAAPGGGTYIHQWVFDDAGTIHAMLGVTGQLDSTRDSLVPVATGWPYGPIASPRYATNRFHTAYWRLDFALGGQNNDQLQQLDYTTDSVNTYLINQTIKSFTSEGQFNILPEAQRFWVVKDTTITTPAGVGQNISFQIVPQHTSLHRGSDGFTSSDIYVTQNNACEQFASHNTAAAGCGADQLTQFVNGETLTDLVVWVGTTWHQVPRAEDESDIQTHWQGFFLAPRDLTATSPL